MLTRLDPRRYRIVVTAESDAWWTLHRRGRRRAIDLARETAKTVAAIAVVVRDLPEKRDPRIVARFDGRRG